MSNRKNTRKPGQLAGAPSPRRRGVAAVKGRAPSWRERWLWPAVWVIVPMVVFLAANGTLHDLWPGENALTLEVSASPYDPDSPRRLGAWSDELARVEGSLTTLPHADWIAAVLPPISRLQRVVLNGDTAVFSLTFSKASLGPPVLLSPLGAVGPIDPPGFDLPDKVLVAVRSDHELSAIGCFPDARVEQLALNTPVPEQNPAGDVKKYETTFVWVKAHVYKSYVMACQLTFVQPLVSAKGLADFQWAQRFLVTAPSKFRQASGDYRLPGKWQTNIGYDCEYRDERLSGFNAALVDSNRRNASPTCQVTSSAGSAEETHDAEVRMTATHERRKNAVEAVSYMMAALLGAVVAHVYEAAMRRRQEARAVN